MTDSSTFKNMLAGAKKDFGNFKAQYDAFTNEIAGDKTRTISAAQQRRLKALSYMISELQVKLDYIGDGKTHKDKVEVNDLRENAEAYGAYVNSYLRIYNCIFL